jgi:hypothetical protein
MRKFIQILLAVAPILLVRWTARSEPTNSTLAFYVVSEQKIEGGRFIDTSDMPKLGYIAAKPDLVVTNLQEVFFEKDANIVIVPNKDHPILPSDLPQYLVVRLRPGDAKPFLDLTKRSVGKQMLIMLDGRALTSWHGVGRFPEARFEIPFKNQADLKKTEDELKRLVR